MHIVLFLGGIAESYSEYRPPFYVGVLANFSSKPLIAEVEEVQQMLQLLWNKSPDSSTNLPLDSNGADPHSSLDACRRPYPRYLFFVH